MRVFIVGCLFLSAMLHVAAVQAQQAKPKAEGHWGENVVGFRWEEKDSRDGRWNQTDTGRFLTSALQTPTGMVAKAFSLRLGDAGDQPPVTSVCYDLSTLTLKCGWTGGFLRFDPARFGIIKPPAIEGKIAFSAPPGKAWGKSKVDYQGLHVHGERVVFTYTIDGISVLESPWAEMHGNQWYFKRTLQVAPAKETLSTILVEQDQGITLRGDTKFAELKTQKKITSLIIHPHKETIRLKVFLPAEKNSTTEPASKQVLDGDAQRQFDAVWHYLQHFDPQQPERPCSTSENSP